MYMPVVPQVAIAMHACAQVGAIHSVVFNGFAAKELAPKVATEYLERFCAHLVA
jgi:acyl-coenzyme A synthetase/AMP-(fatty) acid ligase